MFVCFLCHTPSSPGDKPRKHTVRGRDGKIKSEHAVCRECHDLLSGGFPISVVCRRRGVGHPAPPPDRPQDRNGERAAEPQ